MSDYDTLIVEPAVDGVGLIRLNRPAALNALNAQLLSELATCLEALERDEAVRCLVLTGSDKAFAAGADVKEMAGLTYAQAFRENLFADTSERIVRTRKPIIAAVAGYALGGGCELAMMCDFIIAADNAKFGQPESHPGRHPGHRRHPAPDAAGGQVQGHGPDADRPHDGRGGGGAIGTGQPGRAAGEAAGRGHDRRQEDRRPVAAGRGDEQGDWWTPRSRPP